jgi:hypothetical protein
MIPVNEENVCKGPLLGLLDNQLGNQQGNSTKPGKIPSIKQQQQLL